MSPNNWPSNPPPDFPFEPSTSIRGIAFTGRAAHYTHADTWYPSWASDGNLYSPWTDGNFKYPIVDINHFDCSSDSRNRTNADKGGKSGTGNARITGSDPLHLSVEDLGVQYASPAPYGGRYPCGSLVHNGIWYYGTYCLEREQVGASTGTFMGRSSASASPATWAKPGQTRHTPEQNRSSAKRAKTAARSRSAHRISSISARTWSTRPTAKPTSSAHGATTARRRRRLDRGRRSLPDPRDALARERSTIAPKYEFFAGQRGGAAGVDAGFREIKPLVEWTGPSGCVTMTYIAPLKKYLMCCTDGWPTIETFDTFVWSQTVSPGPGSW